jgi:hypothetical protein
MSAPQRFAQSKWDEEPRFGLIVHHDDGEREFVYDRASAAGKLDRGLDEAPKRGWTLVSMKKDWKRVFSFEK